MHGTQDRYGSKLLAFQRKHGITDAGRELNAVRSSVAASTPATTPRLSWGRFALWIFIGAFAFVLFQFGIILFAEQQLQGVATAEVAR